MALLSATDDTLKRLLSRKSNLVKVLVAPFLLALKVLKKMYGLPYEGVFIYKNWLE